MIITEKIRVTRIIAGTWKNSILIVLICTISYFINVLFLSKYITFPGIVDAILGPALAFFIGFSNNQAYDRWWESRKIWGALVNDSRTWARQIIEFPTKTAGKDNDDLTIKQKKIIKRHLAFLYALKKNLRGEDKQEYNKYLSSEDSETVMRESNIPNAILSLQLKDIGTMYRNKWIDGYQFLALNKIQTKFCDEMGMSERIKNTVFPPTYSFYTKIFVWILIISSTFVISDMVGAWSILFGALIGYVFLTTLVIGQALLNPFDPIPTGISLDQITRTIEINLLEMLGESNIPEQVKSVKGEFIM